MLARVCMQVDGSWICRGCATRRVRMSRWRKWRLLIPRVTMFGCAFLVTLRRMRVLKKVLMSICTMRKWSVGGKVKEVLCGFMMMPTSWLYPMKHGFPRWHGKLNYKVSRQQPDAACSCSPGDHMSLCGSTGFTSHILLNVAAGFDHMHTSGEKKKYQHTSDRWNDDNACLLQMWRYMLVQFWISDVMLADRRSWAKCRGEATIQPGSVVSGGKWFDRVISSVCGIASSRQHYSSVCLERGIVV